MSFATYDHSALLSRIQKAGHVVALRDCCIDYRSSLTRSEGSARFYNPRLAPEVLRELWMAMGRIAGAVPIPAPPQMAYTPCDPEPQALAAWLMGDESSARRVLEAQGAVEVVLLWCREVGADAKTDQAAANDESVEIMREAIAATKNGRNAKADTLIDKAGIREADARAALRVLEEQGEYKGFARKSTRNGQG